MDLCQEMSHTMPTLPEVTANTQAQMYQGTRLAGECVKLDDIEQSRKLETDLTYAFFAMTEHWTLLAKRMAIVPHPPSFLRCSIALEASDRARTLPTSRGQQTTLPV